MGELVQAATVLAGSGGVGWFADKIFGPTVGLVGDQLKAYFQNRVPRIFAVAEEVAKNRDISLNPIAPGLLARMISDASFSAEDPLITEWWANLFVDAAFAGSNLHAVFSDMMAMIGPREATCLREFISQFDFAKNDDWLGQTNVVMANQVDLLADEAIMQWMGELPIPPSRLHIVRLNFERGQVPWPWRPIRWLIPVRTGDEELSRMAQTNLWFEQNQEAIEILERSRILKFLRVDVPILDGSSWVETVGLTRLGYEFYSSCRGVRMERA